MAATEAEVQDQWGKIAIMLEEARLFGISNSNNWVGMQDELEQAYEGKFVSDRAAWAADQRSALAAILESGGVGFQSVLNDYMVALDEPELRDDPEAQLTRLYDDFVTNSKAVTSRGFSFGTPGAFSAGDIQVVRVTADEEGYDIEAAHPETKTVNCVRDGNMEGAEACREVFEIRGQNPSIDLLDGTKSGVVTEAQAQCADDSLLENAGFRGFSGTAASPTGLDGWTSSAGDTSTQYILDSTTTFRRLPSDGATGTVYSLRVKVSTNLTQKLSVNGIKVDRFTPYFLAVIWKRDTGSGSGSMVIRMGGTNSGTITVSAQTGWVVSLVPTTFGQNNWPKAWSEEDADIAIEVTLSSGYINIAEVIFVPMTQVDWTWWAIVPKATSSFTFPVVGNNSTSRTRSPRTRSFSAGSRTPIRGGICRTGPGQP